MAYSRRGIRRGGILVWLQWLWAVGGAHGGKLVYDGKTTYCWEVRANASVSNISDDRIQRHGFGDSCPLSLTISLSGTIIQSATPVSINWTVYKNVKTPSAMFDTDVIPPLTDKSTGQRVTIVHSNVHTCRDDTDCNLFSSGANGHATTSNQIGNVTSQGAHFATQELAFQQPGRFVVFAHVIVPGRTSNSRYDFAVMSTLLVTTTTADGGQGSMAQEETIVSTGSSAHGMSENQIITIGVVGALLLVLVVLLLILTMAKRRQRCRVKRNPSDPVSLQPTLSTNSRSRCSNWSELYAHNDHLPSSILYDDSNTIAILRASRASTPTMSPTTERKIADFRHDVARWDMRSSASPITPSSSVILIAAMDEQSDSSLASTPASDCFVPLESLVPVTPPPALLTKHQKKVPFTSTQKEARGRRRRPMFTPPDPNVDDAYPQDSGDEQEVDL